jgi:ATP-dependent Clp protease protease subunit
MATNKYRFRAQKSKTTLKLYIYDVIDGWYGISAGDVKDKIEEAGDVALIQVYINSPGGSIFEALAIYNLLVRHEARVEVYVDGMAVSAASFVAMAGDTRTIAKNAWFMIHNGITGIYGTKEELRKYADLLEGLEAKIAEVYADRSGEDVEQFLAWMDDETWFNAEDAMEAGLVDAISDNQTSDKSAARVENRSRAFDLSQYNKVPDALRAGDSPTTPFPGRRSLAAILGDPLIQSLQLNNGGEPPMSDTQKPQNTPPVEPPVQTPAPVVDKIELTQAELDAKIAAARAEALAEAEANAGEPNKEEPKPLTDADVRKLVAQAKADSREIIAAYNMAQLSPEQQKALPLHNLVDQPVDAARKMLFDAICLDRKPVGDGGGLDPNENDTDPDDRYRNEYKAGGGQAALDCTEEEYIRTRRIDNGTEIL